MRVTNIAVDDTSVGATLTADVVWDDPRRGVDTLTYTFRGVEAERIRAPGDSLLAAVLLPAMGKREDVTVDAPVSGRLLRNAEELVSIWTRWIRGWHPSGVSGTAVDRSDLHPTEVAALFSGGLDSFYTVLREQAEPITTLITLRRFDAVLHPPDHELKRMALVAAAAEGLGRKHIIVDSNAMHWGYRQLPPNARRGTIHHGAVLASLVLALGSMVRRCYIAGSETFERRAWGSHPRVDPLWSTESLEFVHDDEQPSRTGKYALVANSDVALDHLLVCNVGDENCRVCDKCQGAALMLHIAGVLDRSKTLGPVTPETLRRVRIGVWHHEIWATLRDQTSDPALKRAISVALRGAKLRRLARPAGGLLRRAGLR